MRGAALSYAETVLVSCPWCCNPQACLTPTRKPLSFRLVCIGGCGRAGFVSSDASRHALAVWREMWSDTAFAVWYAEALESLLDVEAGEVTADICCPACLGGGATVKPDVRGEVFVEHRSCRIRMFGGGHPHGWGLVHAQQSLFADPDALGSVQIAFRQAGLRLAMRADDEAKAQGATP